MSPASTQAEHLLVTVIVQLTVIIIGARLFGALFRWFGQPQVCGEIAAGLVLGPSLFGGIFPSLSATVFDPIAAPIFSVLSQIGLVLMMFLIGLDFDFGHLSRNRSTAMSVSITGIVAPFALGFVLGGYLHPLVNVPGDWVNFALFMGAAMSITAIPVLGRIMIEMNIHRTRLGSLTISAAAISDAVGWIILALITATVRASFDQGRAAMMVAEVIGFGLAMIFLVRPAAVRLIRRFGGELSLDALAVLLIAIFASALVTSAIGVSGVFGAFLLGAILYDQHEFAESVKRRLHDFVTVCFLPIFFTYTGLRTDAGAMSGGYLWLLCGLVMLTAVAGKFGGCALAARLNGLPWRESAMIGVMMNTRGLVELIVINLGYDLGVIPKSVFFMLVFMAVATTYMTSPLLRVLIRNSEVEAEFRKSALNYEPAGPR